MRIGDLFESDMVGALRQQVIDFLIPLVSHNIDYVTVKEIESMLIDAKTGLTIDRALVMQVLDPTRVKPIKKIEGDKVYLSVTAGMNSDAKSEEESEKEAEKISDKAAKVAKSSIKDK